MTTDPIVQETRDIAASLSLDMANARAERWRVRTMEARFDAAHFEAEYDHACDQNEALRASVERVENLAHEWEAYTDDPRAWAAARILDALGQIESFGPDGGAR